MIRKWASPIHPDGRLPVALESVECDPTVQPFSYEAWGPVSRWAAGGPRLGPTSNSLVVQRNSNASGPPNSFSVPPILRFYPFRINRDQGSAPGRRWNSDSQACFSKINSHLHLRNRLPKSF
ncbi:hypothetical protein SDJN03_26116, partial [Cucurbita argyrosperma subsp. sororia]